MNERMLKTGWHLGLALLAFYEMYDAETPFRKMFCGACAGWHLGAALVDYQDTIED